MEQSLFHTVTDEDISQSNSSSEKGAEKKFEEWPINRKRSVEKTINDRKEKGNHEGKKHRRSLWHIQLRASFHTIA